MRNRGAVERSPVVIIYRYHYFHKSEVKYCDGHQYDHHHYHHHNDDVADGENDENDADHNDDENDDQTKVVWESADSRV